MLIYILPDLFYHLFYLELTVSSECLSFDSGLIWRVNGLVYCIPEWGVVPSVVLVSFILRVREIPVVEFESTPRGGVNRCMANLMVT